MGKAGLVIGSILGVAALGVVVWMAAPLFYDKEVSEALPEVGKAMMENKIMESRVLAGGTFEGFDALHDASGTAKIIKADGKTYLRFEDDFQVTNGPDLFVHLGRNNQYDSEARLGRLKGNVGSQNYEIPESIDVEEFDEAWIWCRAFSVPFGKAELK